MGLSDKVRIYCGNALDMPFDNASFDVVWSQNTLMNIDDKPRLFQEIIRVLHPGGIFAFESILAGPVKDIHFPVFWAESPSLSFLDAPEEIRAMLSAADMRELKWEDTTKRSIVSQSKRKQAIERDGPPILGLGVIVPTDFLLKMDNHLKNNEEGRTVTVQAVYVV